MTIHRMSQSGSISRRRTVVPMDNGHIWLRSIDQDDCAIQVKEEPTSKISSKAVIRNVTITSDKGLDKVKLPNIEVLTTYSMAKNFGLTEEGFQEMAAQLRRGDNQLLEKVFLTHIDICIQYLIKKYRISHDEAYDQSMNALLLFRTKISQGKIKYGNLKFLFTQMASQLLLKRINKDNRETAVIEITQTQSEEVDYTEALALLNKSWPELGKECQQLLKYKYYGNMHLNEIAKLLGKTDFTIRKQKQRCVQRLRSLFAKHSNQFE